MRKKGKPKKKKLLSGFLAQKTVYFMADNFKAEGIYLQRILQICQMSLFSILPRKIPIGAKGLKNLWFLLKEVYTRDTLEGKKNPQSTRNWEDKSWANMPNLGTTMICRLDYMKTMPWTKRRFLLKMNLIPIQFNITPVISKMLNKSNKKKMGKEIQTNLLRRKIELPWILQLFRWEGLHWLLFCKREELRNFHQINLTPFKIETATSRWSMNKKNEREWLTLSLTLANTDSQKEWMRSMNHQILTRKTVSTK